MSKLISVIVPALNEEANVPVLYNVLQRVLDGLAGYTYEIIFVDDGSTDRTLAEIVKLADKNSNVKYLSFTRNFGKEVATSAGLKEARGAVVIMLDADLQHPVDLIPEFIRRWENGVEVVTGVREKNQGEGVVKKIGSTLFYKLLNLIGEIRVVPHTTDYRLLDRRVVDEFNRFTERNRLTRGLLDWLGFKQEYVSFKAGVRRNGRPRYGFWKLTKLALASFVSHSLFPLKLAGYLGVFITIVSGALGVFIILNRYILNDPLGLRFSSSAILAVINLFLIGIVLACIGLVALYIGNIHGEVANRPLYIVRKKGNLE